MKTKKLVTSVAAAVFCVMSGAAMAKKPVAANTFEPDPTILEALGKEIFFDTNMSTPGNKQGCVSCHDPRVGWTFPDSEINAVQVVNPGAKPHATGLVKPPTIAYAAFVEPFQRCSSGVPRHCGGLFWDGRAEGWGLLAADPLLDPSVTGPIGENVSESVMLADLPLAVQGVYTQFLGPLADQALNPAQKGIEQNAGEKKVCQRVKTAPYKALYEQAFGEPIDCRKSAYSTSFKRIAVAIAAYEKSEEVSPFSSPRDTALYRELACLWNADNSVWPEYKDYYDAEVCAAEDPTNWGEFPLVGLKELTEETLNITLKADPNWGHDVFYNTVSPGSTERLADGACWNCHADRPGIDTGVEPRQLYAEASYHNIGTPFNREIPGVDFEQIVGLAGHMPEGGRFGAPGSVTPEGSFRTPTLRDVDKRMGPDFVKAYAHNGYFKSLESIVHFYNTARQRLADLNDPNSGLVQTPTCESLGIVHATEAEALGPNWQATGVAQCWPAREFVPFVGFNLGQLGLTLDEEAAIVAYMQTLTDTVVVEAP
jgi:cytochrome c peroxidase